MLWNHCFFPQGSSRCDPDPLRRRCFQGPISDGTAELSHPRVTRSAQFWPNIFDLHRKEAAD